MMARYVDIDKFRDEAFYADTEADIASYVGKHGYADVEEVRHGHWIEVSLGLYKCSICGNHICGFDANIKKIKRCEECGAKMDGKRES